jgi:hypothetical protein
MSENTWEVNDDEVLTIKDPHTKNVVYKCDKSCFNDSFYNIKDADGNKQFQMVLLYAPVSKKYGY